MATKVKIKINDAVELREQLDHIYENKSQMELAQWAINLAKHILSLVGYDYENESIIIDGFATNEKWQIGEARMHDVRQAGFKVHRLAKETTDVILQAALRVVGQAIGTGHMREHAMVASDYAVKVINLKFPADMEAVKSEREWQIRAMK
ncbi:hypothetical protein CEB3_c23910 [Peptococcaceae bacterium CEB3]|nr:hypothetical protein CEB3_c23910 [Peptococcaceae bacterium CEB3]